MSRVDKLTCPSSGDRARGTAILRIARTVPVHA